MKSPLHNVLKSISSKFSEVNSQEIEWRRLINSYRFFLILWLKELRWRPKGLLNLWDLLKRIWWLKE